MAANAPMPTAPLITSSGSFWNCTQWRTCGEPAITSCTSGRKSATGVCPRKKYAAGLMRSKQYCTSFAFSRRSSGASTTPMR